MLSFKKNGSIFIELYEKDVAVYIYYNNYDQLYVLNNTIF